MGTDLGSVPSCNRFACKAVRWDRPQVCPSSGTNKTVTRSRGDGPKVRPRHETIVSCEAPILFPQGPHFGPSVAKERLPPLALRGWSPVNPSSGRVLVGGDKQGGALGCDPLTALGRYST